MILQSYIVKKFKCWSPPAPVVIQRSKSAITLAWEHLEPFGFLASDLLYKIERNNKIPQWVVAYSGGETSKLIDNLAPKHPHRFRLKLILKASAVERVADKAVAFYTHEKVIYEIFNKINSDPEANDIGGVDTSLNKNIQQSLLNANGETCNSEENSKDKKEKLKENTSSHVCSKASGYQEPTGTTDQLSYKAKHKWVESLWSQETWTNTDTDGTSAICFSMAVRCGYLKQVQVMLEERSELISIINCNTGFTPLATAVKKGDVQMVRYLVSFGADVNQTSTAGQTPLHLAVLSRNIALAEFLLAAGANPQDRDWNGLQIEHYAVDSCSLEMVVFVLDRGGDVSTVDNNGWTPLFRAVCQDAENKIIEELIRRGSNVQIKDRAGLPLASVAKLLKTKSGCARASILRLVDPNYPHEKALANFTRLTKKVHNVQSLLKSI